MLIPDDLRYTSDHEWVAVTDGDAVRVGITDFAQDALGDIVYVQLPDVGTPVDAGGTLGEVESTKSVSEIYAPISGVVTARNDALAEAPELINSEPYMGGWLVEIEPSNKADVDALLDPTAYETLTKS
jgi:glycine cleavage system H protein